MSDRQLGEAMLKLDLASVSGTTDPQVEKLLAADLKRVKRLTWVATGLWIVAAIGALAVYILSGLAFPMIVKIREDQHSPLAVLAKLTALNIAIGTLSFAILVAAGLTTLLLVIRSRRAMLRQVNANLLHISEQLKRLESSGRGSGTSGS
jgi:hypothetical protein